MAYHLTREALRLDLMAAHQCAKRHKASRPYVLHFERRLEEEIVMLEPKDHCRIAGSLADWEGLDYSKSLFHTADGCGLPIGNLTSQLLSNVYLNEFDQFMKRKLGCRHYGRYVDDSFVVSTDREWLLSLVPQIRQFLADELQLDLHMGKLHVTDARYGVEFLGGYVKARSIYISTASLHRMQRKVRQMCAAVSVAVRRRGMVSPEHAEAVSRSLNSFLGVLCHYDSFYLRSRLLLAAPLLSIGRFDAGITRFVLHPSVPPSSMLRYHRSHPDKIIIHPLK